MNCLAPSSRPPPHRAVCLPPGSPPPPCHLFPWCTGPAASAPPHLGSPGACAEPAPVYQRPSSGQGHTRTPNGRFKNPTRLDHTREVGSTQHLPRGGWGSQPLSVSSQRPAPLGTARLSRREDDDDRLPRALPRPLAPRRPCREAAAPPPPAHRRRHLGGAGRPLPAAPPCRSPGQRGRAPPPPLPAPGASAAPTPEGGEGCRGTAVCKAGRTPEARAPAKGPCAPQRARGAHTRPGPPLRTHSATSTYCLVRLLHLRQLQCLQRERAALRSDGRLCPASDGAGLRLGRPRRLACSLSSGRGSPPPRLPAIAARDAQPRAPPCSGCLCRKARAPSAGRRLPPQRAAKGRRPLPGSGCGAAPGRLSRRSCPRSLGRASTTGALVSQAVTEAWVRNGAAWRDAPTLALHAGSLPWGALGDPREGFGEARGARGCLPPRLAAVASLLSPCRSAQGQALPPLPPLPRAGLCWVSRQRGPGWDVHGLDWRILTVPPSLMELMTMSFVTSTEGLLKSLVCLIPGQVLSTQESKRWTAHPAQPPTGDGTACSAAVPPLHRQQWQKPLQEMGHENPPGAILSWSYWRHMWEKMGEKAPSAVTHGTTRSTQPRSRSSPKWMQRAKLQAGKQNPMLQVKDHKWLGFPSHFEVFHIHPKLHILYVTLSNNITTFQNIPYVSWNHACIALKTTAAECHSIFEFKICNLK